MKADQIYLFFSPQKGTFMEQMKRLNGLNFAMSPGQKVNKIILLDRRKYILLSLILPINNINVLIK